jgi:hypothetical protein
MATVSVSPSRVGVFDVSVGTSDHFPLFGELVLQLLALSAGASTLVICDGCGEFFQPERRRAEGRFKFCQDCGDKVARKLFKRRKAAEKRKATKASEAPGNVSGAMQGKAGSRDANTSTRSRRRNHRQDR